MDDFESDIRKAKIYSEADPYNASPLYHACRYGWKEVAKVLLEQTDCDVNSQSEDHGDTVCHMLARKGNVELLQLILAKKECDVNCQNKSGRTPLHEAIWKHELVTAIVDSGKYIDIAIRDNFGNTPFALAFAEPSLSICKTLLLHLASIGADVPSSVINVKDGNRNTILHKACKACDLDLVTYVAPNDFHGMLNFPNAGGDTPLHIACRRQSFEIVKLLVACTKCNVNIKNNDGRTALHEICHSPSPNALNILFILLKSKNTFNVLVKDERGSTAQQYLRSSQHSDSSVTDYMSSMLAKYAKYSKLDDTLLHVLCLNGPSDLVKSLVVNESCDISATNSSGQTALHFACMHKDVNEAKLIVQTLLSCKNRLNACARDINGFTALHQACISKNDTVVQLLLENTKCDINCCDKVGRTPLHLACRGTSLSPTIVQTLLNCGQGCDANVLDSDGNTPLKYAHEGGHTDRLKVCLALLDFVKSDDKVDINCVRTEDGNLILHDACLMGDVHLVKMITKLEHSLSDRVNTFSRTPLHELCRGTANKKDSHSIASLLLEKKKKECQKTLLDSPRRTVIAYISSSDDDGMTPLHLACLNGKENLVSLLVEQGCDVNITNKFGRTAFQMACNHSDRNVALRLVDRFLEQGCQTDMLDEHGNTPLHEACIKCFPLLVRKLEDGNHCPNKDGKTPLHLACGATRSYRKETVHALLQGNLRSFDVNNKDVDGKTPLMVAVSSGDKDIVVSVMELKGCDTCCCDNGGDTPLHVAAVKFYPEILQLLCASKKCDVNCINILGQSPLIAACALHKEDRVIEIVKGLFETGSGCNPNIVDNTNRSALHYVCKHQNTVTASFLIDLGSDVTIQDDFGNTPLHYACKNRCLAIVKNIMAVFPRVSADLQNKEGKTSLHEACEHGNVELVSALLEACDSFDVNCKDESGATPLFLATKRKMLDVCKALLRYKYHETVNVQLDSSKETLLHTACSDADLSLVNLIVSNVQTVSLKNNKNENALHNVCYSSRPRASDVVEVLLKVASKDDINCQGNSGFTPLHAALYCQNAESAKLLTQCELCDVNIQDPKGNTPLYVAIKKGMYQAAKDIIKSGRCNLNVLNANGDSPLHVAVKYCESIIHLVLEDDQADVNVQDKDGDTPLLVAVKISSRNTVQDLLKVSSTNINLSNSSGLTPLLIAIHKHNTNVAADIILSDKCDLNCLTPEHQSPLHLACAAGNSAVVTLLVKDKSTYLNAKDVEGNTPLHVAIKAAKFESYHIVQCLLATGRRCDVNAANSEGNTPLHIACSFGVQTERIVFALLSTGRVDPLCMNIHGSTPVQLTQNYKIINQLFSKISALKKKHPVESVAKIFVTGNAGVGKSTLIEVLCSGASGLRKLGLRSLNVSDVEEKTAGIIFRKFQSKKFGAVGFYDFAGQPQYYSSHSAIVRSAVSSRSSAPIFIVVVDISKELSEVGNSLHTWLSFIENHCEQVTLPPHLLVVGSHKDVLKKKRGDLVQRSVSIQEIVGARRSSFNYIGFVPIDCRKMVSAHLEEFRSLLSTSCKLVRDSTPVNFGCHILSSFIQENFQSKRRIACQISELEAKIKSEEAMLPHETEQLLPLLHTMHEREQILLLQDTHKSDKRMIWIIFDKNSLISEINGTLFAPENFREHRDFAHSTGLVPVSKISEAFPSRDVTMITSFMTLLEYCKPILDNTTLEVIKSSLDPSTDAVEEFPSCGEFYFFPALVNISKPTHLWKSSDEFVYQCGWCLVGTKPEQHLTSRFLHVLLLRLAFKFALPPPEQLPSLPFEETTPGPVITRRCSVWKNGLQWLNQGGIEVLVEVDELSRKVVLLMRHGQGCEFNCARERSDVIRHILRIKKDFCSRVEMAEFLISPGDVDYPIHDNVTLFSLSEVFSSLLNFKTKPYVLDCIGKTSCNAEKLVELDPYTGLGVSVQALRSLFPDSSQSSELRSVLPLVAKAACDQVHLFQRIIDPENKHDTIGLSCVQLFQLWSREHCGATVEQFREEVFDAYSILCGRSPLDMLASKYTLVQVSPSCSATQLRLIESISDEPLHIDFLNRVNALLTAVVDWQHLGLALELSANTLDIVSADYPRNAARCLTEVLALWLHGEGKSIPTWRTLAKALLSPTLNRRDIVERMSALYSTKVVATSSTTATLSVTLVCDLTVDQIEDMDDSEFGIFSLHMIEREVNQLNRKWFHLGLALGIRYHTLKNIESNYPQESRLCMVEMLKQWLKSVDIMATNASTPSWRALVIGLSSSLVNEKLLVQKIASSHLVF